MTCHPTPEPTVVIGGSGGRELWDIRQVHVDHAGLTCGNEAAAPCRRFWS